MKYKIILVVLFGLAKNSVYSQNKKEQIEALNFSIDSLEKVSLEKSNEIELLKIKIIALTKSDNEKQLEIDELKKENILINEKYKEILSELEKLKIEIENAKKIDLSDWIRTELRISISSDSLKDNQINLAQYSTQLSDELKKEIFEDYWLGSYLVNSVHISENGILINLSTDVYSKNLILSDDFLIISYHVDLGSEGGSIVYNFKTKQFDSSDYYAIELTSKSEILVENDYYDSRDINDPNYEGHIFETGTFNLLSNKYTFITKE